MDSMRRVALFFLLSFIFFLTPQAQTVAKLDAFPGAEGFGRYTTGGRGGAVYHVTSLADDGSEGTLRWACNKKGTRTIVFDVHGTIFLKSELKLKNDGVTIAGQTAPGDGVCVADYPFVIGCSNVIIRYMRFRLGNRHVSRQEKDGGHEGDGLGGMDGHDIIVDHCSVSWSIDECLSVYGSKNLTVQWCLAAQSLVNSGHTKGAHGYGGNWGGSGATYHHNLLCHHTSRCPRLGPRPSTQLDERVDMRNNVFYNYAGESCYGAEGMHVNIVNNYYKPGPGNKNSEAKKKRICLIGIRTTAYTHHGTAEANDWDKMWHVWGTFYVNGNYNCEYPTMDEWNDGIIKQVNNSKVDNTFTAEVKAQIHLTEPIAFEKVSTHTAADAYEAVLKYAGASRFRDAIDGQMVDDTRHNTAYVTGEGLTPGFINSQDDWKPADADETWSPWPELLCKTLEVERPDTDGDGIPDAWETDNGLDPNDASDGRATGSDGYTNLERWMNSLVDEITNSQNKGATVEGGLPTAALTPRVKSKEIRDKSSVAYDLTGRPVGEGYHGLEVNNGHLVIK